MTFMVAEAASTAYAAALLSGLVEAGVRHVVLSPGSRSQALALVAAEFERAGAIALQVRIDERVAGFTALGIGIETGVPAVVVTTSGTAAANLHPAVLEARAANVPLIVVTADRPDELRGIRSNQTSDQAGLFGTATPWARDADALAESDAPAEARAGGRRPAGGSDPAGLARELFAAAAAGEYGPGPAHLNLAFRAPLSSRWTAPASSPLAEPTILHSAAGQDHARLSARRRVEAVGVGPRTVVVAGAAAGEEAERVAREGGWPLLAEVVSGAHFGPNLVVAYRELLSDADFGGRVERAIVFGHPTLSREVPALLERDGVEVFVVDRSRPDFYNPGHRARAVGDIEVMREVRPRAAKAEPEGLSAAPRSAEQEWLGRWVRASRALLEAQGEGRADERAPDQGASHSRDPKAYGDYVKAEFAAVREPVTRRMLVEAVWRFTWPHDRLVVGASRLARDLDRAAPGKKLRVIANRGLAGIDGTVSTAIGVGLGLRGVPSAPEPVTGLSPAADRVPAPRAIAHGGVVRVLLGDLTLLHDAGALLQSPDETMPPIQVIVGNDGGGTIFDTLEVRGTADPRAFRRVMTTPREVDLAALARAYGWTYRRAATRGELDQALSALSAPATLIEVPLTP
nr:2-succinyl-5-enolpyruvyl-6-hydroxy-3-cyclohexene-1-carboxylic-acid synthase [Gryllotalpicola sp.]